jgi:hypothetical protein
MRRAVLYGGGVLAVLGLTAALLWVFRAPIIEFAAARAMTGVGLEKPSLKFQSLGLSHLELADLTAGADADAPDLSVSKLRAEFGLGGLLMRGRVRSVALSPGSARVLVDESGAISLAGWRPDPDAKPAPPPFDRLTIEAFDIVAATPKGPAKATVKGKFAMTSGGEFGVVFDAPEAGFATLSLAGAEGAATIKLEEDGVIDIAGAIAGDIRATSGVAKDVDADFFAALKSWRGFFGDGPRGVFGRAGARVKSSTLEAEGNPSIAAIPSAGAGAVKALTVKGSLAADFSAKGVIVRLDEGPVTIAADRGDELKIAGGEDGVLYELQGETGRARVEARLRGPLASGEGVLAAATADGERWSIDADAALTEQTIAGVTIAGLKASFDGEASDNAVTGRFVYDGLIRSAQIGRLRIADMPAAGTLNAAADLAARTFAASLSEGECLRVDRAGFRLPDQDLDARLSLAKFCAGAAPVLSIKWGGDDRVRLEGLLTSADARLRMGQTDFAGAPPAIRFALDYEPAANTTRASGDFSGGDGVLTKSLRLSGAAGVFDAALTGAALTATASLSSMTIAQAAELELVAPVVVAGQARLSGDKAAFDFDVKTPRGALLGRGKGAHDVKSGKGEAVFDSGDLTFTAGGLQPDRLIPAMKGVISAASGAAGGSAVFSWSPAGVSSSGAAAAKNVSFQGPGVAVTRTEGVTGDLTFASLSPVATAGEQTILIRKIDLDALDLENGSMRFSLPGDDTLHIAEAEFPWFGGTIGAYNSTIALSGASSETKLQIDNVRLADLLGFFKIDGLSGEGTIEGVLPISFEGGRARINNGILSAKGAGVIRYTGDIAAAAGGANPSTSLVFEALREFQYESLSTTIDGPLDGTLNFKVFFEGRSDVSMTTSRGKQTVKSPFIFRVNIEAPFLSLIDQAAVSLDVRRQIESATRAPKPPVE